MGKKGHLAFEKRALNIRSGCVRTLRTSGTPMHVICEETKNNLKNNVKITSRLK